MGCAVIDILVPCKGFARGKSRLADVLSPQARAQLCRQMLTRTLKTLAPLPAHVAVITEDAEVAALALSYNAITLPCPEAGLNAALTQGAALLAPEGSTRPLMILPADLAGYATGDLAAVLGGTSAVLRPDRDHDGTNLMILPTAIRQDFPFSYGPQSFARHGALIRATCAALDCRADPAFATDIDTARDLAAWEGPVAIFTKGRDYEAA